MIGGGYMVARYLTEVVESGDGILRVHSTKQNAKDHVEKLAQRRVKAIDLAAKPKQGMMGYVEWAGLYRIKISGVTVLIETFDGTDRGDGIWGGWMKAK